MALEEADLRDETEMENTLKNDAEQIEKGLMVIANQVKTPKGRIDLLCLDAEDVLTIIELKISSDQNQLIQTIGYFDWAIENIDWLKDAYKIKIADQKPRIILVAKEFDNATLTLAKYWSEDISKLTLYKYGCFLIDGKKQILCSELFIQKPAEVLEKPRTIPDHLNYIKDEAVKENLVKALDVIKKFSEKYLEVVSTKLYVAIKYKGRNFTTIYTKRDSFYFSWVEANGNWYYKSGLKKMSEISEVIEEDIKKAFSLVGGKLV